MGGVTDALSAPSVAVGPRLTTPCAVPAGRLSVSVTVLAVFAARVGSVQLNAPRVSVHGFQASVEEEVTRTQSEGTLPETVIGPSDAAVPLVTVTAYEACCPT